MQKIVPNLWYDDAAEEAARLYARLVPGSSVGPVVRYGAAGREIHGRPEGSVMTVEMDLAGTCVVAMNGGPAFRFTPAVSLFVTLDDRAAVDRLWSGLLDGGTALMPLDAYGWSPRYGWLQDRWGLNWQIALGDPAAAGRRVSPCLMFCGDAVGRAEDAMADYVALFPDGRIDLVSRYDGTGPDAAGTIRHARFRLAGETFLCMDSALPHLFGFNEAVSLAVACDDQAEIDRYWSALSARPEAEACGWLKDAYGLSWQVVPRDSLRMLGGPDRAQADRVMSAFLTMKKPDVAALEAAFAA